MGLRRTSRWMGRLARREALSGAGQRRLVTSCGDEKTFENSREQAYESLSEYGGN